MEEKTRKKNKINWMMILGLILIGLSFYWFSSEKDTERQNKIENYDYCVDSCIDNYEDCAFFR